MSASRQYLTPADKKNKFAVARYQRSAKGRVRGERYRAYMRTYYLRKSLERYQHNRNYFLRQVGGKCAICGFSSDPDILQFDHIEPLGDVQLRRFTTDLRACHIRNPQLWNHFAAVQVLCPNCHTRKTLNESLARRVPA